MFLKVEMTKTLESFAFLEVDDDDPRFLPRDTGGDWCRLHSRIEGDEALVARLVGTFRD